VAGGLAGHPIATKDERAVSVWSMNKSHKKRKFKNPCVLTQVSAGMLFLFCCFLFITGCQEKPEIYVKSAILMDTFVEISAYGTDAPQAVDEAIAAMERIADMTDYRISGSDIHQINLNAGVKGVNVDPHIMHLLQRVLELNPVLHRYFQLTMQPVAALWGFGTDQPTVPGQEELSHALLLVNDRSIVCNKDEGQIFLGRQGMAIDLGGIAKGYAVEVAAQSLLQSGIHNAMINAGGQIKVLGSKPDKSAWRVGIQDPRSESILEVIELRDGQVLATSGDYQRFFESSGRRYHHLLDPLTGFPATLCRSATVLGTDATMADILSTAIFVAGPDYAEEILVATGTAATYQVIIVSTKGDVLRFGGGE
jgi:thiamine biosynthesis lipoprotein